MRKNAKNAGFSLIELIVTISVITVLTGVFVPRFVVYVNARRQMACVANRDALLNIYEKAVYDNKLLIETEDLKQIIEPESATKLNTEYSNQAKDYLTCSSGGTFKVHIVGATAYIACTEHPDEVCSVTFDNWAEKAAVVIDADPEYDVPTDPVDELEGVTDPEEEETPAVDTTVTVNTGVWPRLMDSQGHIDERWAAVGLQPGKVVPIPNPVHFIDITGVEIVVVKPINVRYEDAAYPLGKGANALDGVVAASGVVYSATNEPAKYIQNTEGHMGTETKITTYDVNNISGTTVRDEKINNRTRAVTYWNTFWCGDPKCENVGTERSYLAWDNKQGKDVTKTETVKQGRKHTHETKVDKWIDGDEYITYRVNYGDMFQVGDLTYIYTYNTGSEVCVALPDATQTSFGVDYNGWYRVPAITN